MVTAEIRSTTNIVGSRGASHSRLLSIAWAFGALIAGCLFGCSAPGIDAWYLAWIGLAPLFWACLRDPKPVRCAALGTFFGFGYNLVYLQWYLQIRPSQWTGIFSANPAASGVCAWLGMSLLQGAFVGVYCLLLALLPWRRFPLFAVAPLMWVVLIEKLANHPALLGVPWSMLEYSQYQQPAILQIASIIGGSGIACAIVLCNLLLASVMLPRLRNWNASLLAILLLMALPAYGEWRIKEAAAAQPKQKLVTVAALQGNLSPDVHDVSRVSSIKRFITLSANSSAEICVWPEWSLPIDWTGQQDSLAMFAEQAKSVKQVWVLGTFDTAGGAGKYNAVGAIDSDGTIVAEPYRKRFLVPFGEYVPKWIYCSPLMLLLDPRRSNGEGELAGGKSMTLRTSKADLAPLVCFENCLPSLTAEAVRNGSDLLVDCSNTRWFNYSNVLGKQLIAFSVMRAVENHRSFVFCTVLGPSAIIDSNGRIIKQARVDQPIALEATVPLETDITPFTRFCAF